MSQDYRNVLRDNCTVSVETETIDTSVLILSFSS